RVMGKEKAFASSGSNGWGQLFAGLTRADLYKRTQGKITRQLTCLAIWTAFALGAWRLHSLLQTDLTIKYGVPAVVLLAGLWIGYRIANISAFCDFFIPVEVRHRKV